MEGKRLIQSSASASVEHLLVLPSPFSWFTLEHKDSSVSASISASAFIASVNQIHASDGDRSRGGDRNTKFHINPVKWRLNRRELQSLFSCVTPLFCSPALYGINFFLLYC